jgi:hypothetical protein
MPVNPYSAAHFARAGEPPVTLTQLEAAAAEPQADPRLATAAERCRQDVERNMQGPLVNDLHATLVGRDTDLTTDAGNFVREVTEIEVRVRDGLLRPAEGRAELRDLNAVFAGMVQQHRAIADDFQILEGIAGLSAADFQADRIRRGLIPRYSLPRLSDLL